MRGLAPGDPSPRDSTATTLHPKLGASSVSGRRVLPLPEESSHGIGEGAVTWSQEGEMS